MAWSSGGSGPGTAGPDATFVLLARGARHEDAVLDLVDLDPATLRVSWTGSRRVTCLSTGQLLDLWCIERLAVAPATFSSLGARLVGDQPVRLDVREPRIVGSGLRWTVTTDGRLPRSSGACALVLNPPEQGGRRPASFLADLLSARPEPDY